MLILSFSKLFVAAGLLNVWLIRAGKKTAYRGGNAQNMWEEFAVYGLPAWVCYTVGTLKVGAALGLLAGFWFPVLVLPSAGLVAVLMLGALAMHLKVGDPWVKSVPAFSVLVLCLTICWLQYSMLAGS
jgi:uncharacterized membrane protein YkgB